MSDTDFDIYVIQDPDYYVYLPKDSESKDSLQGQLYNLHRFFAARRDNPIYVKSLKDFVLQVLVQVIIKRQAAMASPAGLTSLASGGGKIRNLIIAAHGSPGVVYIGSNAITGSDKELAELRKLAPYFARDANVYVLACRCGQTEDLLRKLSGAFGGAKVHGYTDYIVTRDYGITVTLSDGTDNGGKHIVCFRTGKCTGTNAPLPATNTEGLGPPFERRDRVK